MTRRMLPGIETAVAAKPYGGRGEVYRHLRSNYEAIRQAIEQYDPSWQVIADILCDAGVVGQRGLPPTARAVGKVWKRVCRDVLAEFHNHQMGLSKPVGRRRLQPGWVPSGYWPATSETAKAPAGVSGAVPASAYVPKARVTTASDPDAQRSASGKWLGVPRDEPSTAPPGSVQSVREEANLRSGLMRDGTFAWDRKS